MSTISGTSGADTLDGTPDADDINGLSGDDLIHGQAGNDLIVGEQGSDTLYGGDGDDQVYAGYRFNSAFSDLGAHNYLYGEAGNDVLIGKEGIDLLDGGIGNDIISASESDTVLGGDGNDLIVDTDNITWHGATIDAGAGDDEIRFFTNASRVTGGSGADLFNLSITQNSGNFSHESYGLVMDFNQQDGDRLLLATGAAFLPNAIFRGDLQSAQFSLQGGQQISDNSYGPGFIEFWTWRNAGLTYLIGDLNGDGVLNSADFVLTFSGNVPLSADSFQPGVFQTLPGGGAGADVFVGTSGSDTYYGFNGDDQISGLGGSDNLYGNNGNDAISGGDGEDVIYGANGDDILHGDAGFDTLIGGAGSDTVYGGDGNDSIQTAGTTAGDNELPGTINRVFGDGGDDNIAGSGGHDEVYGGDGNDSIGAAGFLDGGDGNDSIRALSASTVTGGAGDDVLIGSNGDDRLFGGSGVDNLQGGSGDDVLSGGRGDTLNGDFGRDLAILDWTDVSGTGEFRFFGGNDLDTVDLSSAQIGLTIDLSNSSSQMTAMGALTLDSVESVIDGQFGSSINGNAVANVLNGAGGDDVLNGAGGGDSLFGGDGADIVHGGVGNDTLVGNDNPFVAEADQLFGDDGDDLIYGENADTIDGGTGFDSRIAVNAYDFTLNMATSSIEYAVMDFGNDTITAAAQTVGLASSARAGTTSSRARASTT